MERIKLTITENGKETVEIFTSGLAAHKRIKELYENRKKDLWYYRTNEIKKLESKLEYRWLSKKAKIRLEVELEKVRKDRNETLNLLSANEPPVIKLEICKY